MDQLIGELERSYQEVQERMSDPAVYNDLLPDESGVFGTFYPYMSARPAPGAFRILAVSWDGRAYNLQATGVATTPAQDARLLQALPLPAAPQAGDCPVSGQPGQPVVDIASIIRLPSGSLDARATISDPDGAADAIRRPVIQPDRDGLRSEAAEDRDPDRADLGTRHQGRHRRPQTSRPDDPVDDSGPG